MNAGNNSGDHLTHSLLLGDLFQIVLKLAGDLVETGVLATVHWLGS